MKIFADMDGVLVDYVLGVHRLFGHEPYPYRCPLGEWNFFHGEPFHLTDSDVAPHMNAAFYASLPWTIDGREILKRAEDTVGKENVYILSSPWQTPGCLEGKFMWVQQHCPDYTHRLILTSAKEVCSRPDTVLLDDSEKNCRKFAKVPKGGHAVLVPRPWNVRHPESCLDTGAVKDLHALFNGYPDGRPSGMDEYLNSLKGK